ncbi:MAG: hypothetical protein AAGI46_08345 [Planctomycetota bacterium]
MATRILLVGIEPDSVDYDKWPDLTREKLIASGREVVEALTGAGYEPVSNLIDGSPESVDGVRQKLVELRPEVVVIGAGVRADPDRLALFEQLVNVVIAMSPTSRLAFNTRPWDTVEAVERVLR